MTQQEREQGKLVVFQSQGESALNNDSVLSDKKYLQDIDPRQYVKVEFRSFGIEEYAFANRCVYFGVPIEIKSANNDAKNCLGLAIRALFSEVDKKGDDSDVFGKYIFWRILKGVIL